MSRSIEKRHGQIVMWDYMKWILYAILIAMQLSFLTILARQGGMPEVHTAGLRAHTALYETLLALPLVWQQEDLSRLGLTTSEKPGTCMLEEPSRRTVSVIRLTLTLGEDTYTCVWPSLMAFQAFDTSSRLTGRGVYNRVHMNIPLRFTNGKTGMLQILTISREGKPIILPADAGGAEQ